MPPTDRQRLRVAFNQAAELYDRARPGYPPALFDDLTELAGIGPGCRMLEIGPGTGQAPRRAVRRRLGRHRLLLDRPGGAGQQGRRRATTRRDAGHHRHPPHRRIAGGDEAFFAEVQGCYESWDPKTPPGLRLPTAAEIPTSSDELDRSGRFGPASFRRYEWEQSYSTAGYLDVLLTYSGHRAMEPTAQANLLDCIAGLIDTGYGGRVACQRQG
jgi:hypothetical protein